MSNLNTQKIRERPQILESKLIMELVNQGFHQDRVITCDNNIIHINQQNNNGGALVGE